MSFRLPIFGKRRAPARAHAAPSRRFSRRDDIDLVDPVVAIDPEPEFEETVVSDVVAVAPEPRRYRATISRFVTQTAVVEFTADEVADTHAMAQDLLDSVSPEAWVTQPSDSWGSIDKIEEIDDIASDYEELDDESLIDPELLEPPAELARRARKMTIDDLDIAFQEITTELSMLTDTALVSAEDAAARMAALDGLRARAEALAPPPDDDYAYDIQTKIDELLAWIDEEIAKAQSFVATDAPEFLSRRSRSRRAARRARRGRARRVARKMAGADVLSEIDRIRAAVDETLGADAEDFAVLDALADLQAQAATLYVDPEDVDAETAETALADLRAYIDEQIAALTAAADPDPTLIDAAA